jgi:hypothetical protein
MQRKVLTVVLPFLSAGFICGLIVGRATSVDSSKPETAEHFVALYAKWNHIDSNHGSLMLRAGNRIYFYSTGDLQVSKKFVSALEIANSPAPKIDFDKDLGTLASVFVAAPVTGGVVVTLANAIKPESQLELFGKEHNGLLFAVTVATFGGAALGYYLAHTDNPDVNNEIFQRTIQDPALWSHVEEDWRTLYTEAVRAAPCAHLAGFRDFGQDVLFTKGLNITGKDVPLAVVRTHGFFKLHPEIEAQVALNAKLQQPKPCE